MLTNNVYELETLYIFKDGIIRMKIYIFYTPVCNIYLGEFCEKNISFILPNHYQNELLPVSLPFILGPSMDGASI